MQKYFLSAAAWIMGDSSHPSVRGIVRFFQREDGVLVEVQVTGLPRTETGFFALHIHEGANCDGDGFSNSGGHFNPGKTAHPNHAGDLPPLLANQGFAWCAVYTERCSIEDVIGRTVVIHSMPDDFHTQPSGDSGTKIACGVIRAV